MKSVKVVLVKRGNAKEGMLKLRVIENRTNQSWKSLGIKVPIAYWNKEKSRVKATDKIDYKDINNKIKEFEDEYGTADNASEKIKADKNSYTVFYRGLIPSLSIGSQKKYNTLLKTITDYTLTLNKSDLLFADINEDFVLRFKRYLLEDKNLSANTTNRYLKHYKTTINKAIKADAYSYLKHPFLNIQLERESTVDKYLSKAEVQRIIDLDPATKALKDVRLRFLFSIMCCGMRTSDLHLLSFGSIKSDRITYIMYKTKQQLSVKLNTNLKLLLAERVVETEEAKALKSYADFLKWYTEYKDYIKEKQSEMPATISLDLLKKWKEINPALNSPIEERIAKQDEYKEDQQLKFLKHKLTEATSKVLRGLSTKFPKLFVFPGLDVETFKNFNIYDPTKKQFNQIESRTTIYNKALKELQKAADIDMNITSHVARHTYTNLMLDVGADIYAISKSLNHQSIVATERYIAKFNSKVVDDANDNLAIEIPL
ncbi:phage integrase family protein [Pontibacter mucosus]|uniref:Phage integrase family protein n=1 Tax=Pontibacter mucosus TaxID=1649266 RepID=A0A2T5YDS9_9BACT|nr:site-specific integrase [Pontibacter mucosus]PTX14704.1 phage integrase family protein [Pontibacter mucosus]